MRCPPRIWLKIARIVKYFLQISGDFVTNLIKINSHCVNLVSQAVSESCPSVRDALQVGNELGVLFSQSLPARSKFHDIAADIDWETNFEQIRPLCPTR